MPSLSQIQLGKNGIKENFIQTLKSHFKKHQNVKISVLRNALPDGTEKKQKVKQYAEEILERLGKNYTARIVGFTISVKRWRKEVR